MAQPIQNAPTIPAQVGGTRQQVNLRDFLNTRVAPFLKKALTESLDAEAKYPLQWLGEHLIQQSILYEGNPDSTNIKERFAYKHEITVPTAPSPPPEPTEMIVPEAAPSIESSTPIPVQPEQVISAANGHLNEEEQGQDQQIVEVNGNPPQDISEPQHETSQDVEMENAS